MGLKDFLFGGKQNDDVKNDLGKSYKQDESGFSGRTVPQGPRYYVLRECVTGVTEYGYFCDQRPLGAAMVMTVPGFPVRLQGEGLHLRSDFDKTIFPGVTREIRDEITGAVYAQVTFYAEGTHTLKLPDCSLVVKSQPGAWQFLRDGVHIAQLRRMGQPGSELEFTFRDPLPDHMALLMMSFPLIQIGR